MQLLFCHSYLNSYSVWLWLGMVYCVRYLSKCNFFKRQVGCTVRRSYVLCSGSAGPGWGMLCCPAEFLDWHTRLWRCLHSPSDHICDQGEIPRSLWERDRAWGGKEGGPRTSHTPLPFPMCPSSRARGLPTPKTLLPGSCSCWCLSRHKKSLQWSLRCWQLYRSTGWATHVTSGVTCEKSPSLILSASPGWGCGSWGLTQRWQRARTDY